MRFGSIFRIGSTYLSKPDRETWQKLNDLQKLYQLVQFKHPWLCVELGLLLFGSVYFTILRFLTHGIVIDSTQCIIV